MIIFVMALMGVGLAIGVYLLTRPRLSAALERESSAAGEMLFSPALPVQDKGEQASAVLSGQKPEPAARQEQYLSGSAHSLLRAEAVTTAKEQKGTELSKENEMLRKDLASLKIELETTKTALAKTLNESKERELMKEKEAFTKEVASLKSKLVQMEQEATALRHSLERTKAENAPVNSGPEALKKKEGPVPIVLATDATKGEDVKPGEQKGLSAPRIPEKQE